MKNAYILFRKIKIIQLGYLIVNSHFPYITIITFHADNEYAKPRPACMQYNLSKVLIRKLLCMPCTSNFC